MSSITFDINPEITVILCTYNRVNHLKNCIDSVINQTCQDWELVVVDDGSQDDTFELVNSYLQKIPKIRYLKHQNRKLGYAKNAGFRHHLVTILQHF